MSLSSILGRRIRSNAFSTKCIHSLGLPSFIGKPLAMTSLMDFPVLNVAARSSNSSMRLRLIPLVTNFS